MKTKSVFSSGVAALTIQITKEGLFKEALIIKICCCFCLLFVFAAAACGVGVGGGCGAVVAIHIDFVVVPRGVSYSNDVYELLLSFSFIQIKCLYTFFLTCIDLCSFILDIDECSDAHGSCHANADCQNIVGSFICSCKTGYSGDGFNCFGRLLLLKKGRSRRKTILLVTCKKKSHAPARKMVLYSV